ncbi:hypothetical protein AADZ90_021850 [Aestuariibius sp. 2305UL40-4]|uniref:hypothetical protein n=1 Tax=Aestuariibius violaceus TaxID=3234132 RepID=UPI00398E3228
MVSNLITIGAVALAIALFQSATLVIGGYIGKDTFASFYEAFPQWWQRMLIVILPLPGIGNLLAAYAFQNPIVAGVSFLVLGMWAPLIAAMIIEGHRYDTLSLCLALAISLLGIWLGMHNA